MLRDKLREEGFNIGRKHATTLMRRMGIEALYRKPNVSKKHPKHKIYPYLLRGLTIERANHVRCADISYIPMRHGFMCLFAIMDWATRRILAWRLSSTMTPDFCIEALKEAIARYGSPEIFNAGQDAQFTANDFTDVLKKNGIHISMFLLFLKKYLKHFPHPAEGFAKFISNLEDDNSESRLEAFKLWSKTEGATNQ